MQATEKAVAARGPVKRTASLALWERYGDAVLMASPYRDEIISASEGCHFTDVDGNRYLDLTSGQICAIVGHNHPVVLRRVIDQISRLTHTGTSFLSPPVLEASARLGGLAPGALSRTLLLSTGAEANEYALRLAKVFTGKTGVLALTKGYAGLTLATSSLTNYGKNAAPLVPSTGYILTPDPTECPQDVSPLDYARQLLHDSLEVNRGLQGNVAAIIVEPILSAGGLIVLPDGYLRELRALADRLGALLIADEAQTGMGRTGKWFGVDHDGIVPDILVLSKGVGGGFPSSAVITRQDIAAEVIGKANQFSSHQSDPLGAAATLAVIEVIETEGLVAKAADTGAYLMDQLRGLSRAHPHLMNVRGRGLMVGFDVFRDPARPTPEGEIGRGIEDFCRANGVHLEAIQRNRFRILPPYVIARQDIDTFIAVLGEALSTLAAGKLSIRPAENRQTTAFEKRKHAARAAMEWAWAHSPSDWVRKIRKTLK
jgi:4-aminobutyrate aminotransferase-like enzyme